MTKLTNKGKLKTAMYGLDWIIILRKAIELRPSAWKTCGDGGVNPSIYPIREWKNASDCLCYAVVKEMEEEGLIEKEKEFKTNKDLIKKAEELKTESKEVKADLRRLFNLPKRR